MRELLIFVRHSYTIVFERMLRLTDELVAFHLRLLYLRNFVYNIRKLIIIQHVLVGSVQIQTVVVCLITTELHLAPQ